MPSTHHGPGQDSPAQDHPAQDHPAQGRPSAATVLAGHAAALRLAAALGLDPRGALARLPPSAIDDEPGAASPATGEHGGWTRGGTHCAEAYRAVLAALSEPGHDAGRHPGSKAAAGDGPGAEAAPGQGWYFTALAAALRAQPPGPRAALALVAVEGLSPAEAGTVLGRDPEAVRLDANNARDAVLAAAAKAGDGPGARLLVAEDERVAAFELREVLQRLGHEVVAMAATAGEALSRASFERPDLALMDVRLKGGTDGIAALREMRHAFGVPALVVTAFADQQGRAERAGPVGLEAYGFLLKPWGKSELRNVVSDALLRIAVERQVGPMQPDPVA